MGKDGERGTIEFDGCKWCVKNPAVKGKHPIIIFIEGVGLVPLPKGWAEEELEKYVRDLIQSRQNL